MYSKFNEDTNKQQKSERNARFENRQKMLEDNEFKESQLFGSDNQELIDKITNILEVLDIKSVDDAIKFKESFDLVKSQSKKLEDVGHSQTSNYDSTDDDSYFKKPPAQIFMTNTNTNNPQGGSSSGNGQGGSGSGNGQGGNGTGNGPETNEDNNRVPPNNDKTYNLSGIRLPKYHGLASEDLNGWLWTVKHNYKVHNIPNNKWVDLAGLLIEGPAQYRYRALVEEEPNLDWDSFADKFWSTFYPDNFQQNLRNKLKILR